MIHFKDREIEKDKAYLIQLLILMRKFHIHKIKCFLALKMISSFVVLFCVIVAQAHSKNCWVVLTQLWVKYGQTLALG